MGTRLFVYGSLMSGQPNHGHLRGARLVRVAHTEPHFTLLDLGPYPALVPAGSTSVRGEVYDIEDGVLSAVDRFEGHPDFYRRELIALRGGSQVAAYVLPAPGGAGQKVITSGDWRERRVIRPSSGRAFRRSR